MDSQQGQALSSGASQASPRGFRNAMLFGQFTAGAASLSEFGSLEYRQQTVQSVTNTLGYVLNSIPAEARNFMDPLGLLETYSFSISGLSGDPSAFFSLDRQTNGLKLGNSTPFETNAAYVSESFSSPETIIIGGDQAFPTQTEKEVNALSVDNQLLNLNLKNNKSVSTEEPGGSDLQFVKDITTVNLELADMPVMGIVLRNDEIDGRGTESLTLSYLNGKGGLDSLALLSPAELFSPLTLVSSEDFINNPDPTALLDTLMALAKLPQAIGASEDGNDPSTGSGLSGLSG